MTRARVLFASILVLAAIAAIAAIVACGAQGFDRQSKVDSVRLFAVRANKPYAKPGETVTLEALVADARREKPRPLKVFWIPVVCINPRDDLYYLCFAPPAADAGARFIPAGPLADASAEAGGAVRGGAGPGAGGAAPFGDGGAAGNPLASIPVGVDLSPFLPQGTTFSFRMPDDAVQPRSGADPYGLAIVFNIVCAGRIIVVERDPAGGPQQVPIQCVDEENQKLPPSDYVIGISRVYSYAERVNENPIIEKMTLDGRDVDLHAGITVPKCVANRRDECHEHDIDVRVADQSWEDNPSDVAAGGRQLKEQIWVTYYTDQGEFGSDARLLFDTSVGRVADSLVKYRAPYDPGDGTVWAVVHDNRGGAAWLVVPIHVR